MHSAYIDDPLHACTWVLQILLPVQPYGDVVLFLKMELNSCYHSNVKSEFNFGDGKGLVPAHRHKNPDGSIGGWVAETAWVSEIAFVGHNALVFEHARVMGRNKISGHARVFGQAKIGDQATVDGHAAILDHARVIGKACVSGNAQLRDYATAGEDARIGGSAILHNDTEVVGKMEITCGEHHMKYPWRHKSERILEEAIVDLLALDQAIG